VALLCLAAGFFVRDATRTPPPESPPSWTQPTATPATRPPGRAEAPSAAVAEAPPPPSTSYAPWPAEQEETTGSFAPLEPAPEPLPDTDDGSGTDGEEEETSEIARRREEGLSQLDDMLEEAADELDRAEDLLRSHERQCRVHATATVAPGCQELLAEVIEAWQTVRFSLDAAQKDARKAWLEPGVTRERLSAHGLDSRRIRLFRSRLDRAEGRAE
jgi:hypothetical protein